MVGTVAGALHVGLTVAALGCWPAMAVSAEPRAGVLVLDSGKTEIRFKLDGSLHTTHGTFKLQRGSVTVDLATGNAEGLVVVDANSGDSGNSERDERMKGTVLEAQKFPEVTFSPQRVESRRSADGEFQATVTGTLRLHGTEHPVVLNTHGHLSGDRLTMTSQFTIPYVAWGLTDPSVLFLKVSKDVDLDVTAEGDVTWLSP